MSLREQVWHLLTMSALLIRAKEMQSATETEALEEAARKIKL